MSATATAPVNGQKATIAPQATPSAAQLAALGQEHILTLLSSGSVSVDLAKEALNLLTPKGVPGKLSFKVSEKGALSVYGLNVRFPVTLYVSQWERVIAQIDDLKAFIKANANKLTRKS